MFSVKKILVPTDFSEASRAAVRFATKLARDLSAEIVLVHVIEPQVSYHASPEASLYLPPATEMRRSSSVNWSRCSRRSADPSERDHVWLRAAHSRKSSMQQRDSKHTCQLAVLEQFRAEGKAAKIVV